VNFVVNK